MTVVCDHAEGCTRSAGRCPHLERHPKKVTCLSAACPWEWSMSRKLLPVRCVAAKGEAK